MSIKCAGVHINQNADLCFSNNEICDSMTSSQLKAALGCLFLASSRNYRPHFRSLPLAVKGVLLRSVHISYIYIYMTLCAGCATNSMRCARDQGGEYAIWRWRWRWRWEPRSYEVLCPTDVR